MYEPPRKWRRQDLGGGSVGLLGFVEEWMHLLVPPGAGFRYDESLADRSCWRHALWLLVREPMIGIDEPDRVVQLRTVAVVAMLPVEEHDFVRSALSRQLRRAAMFGAPAAGACRNDEYARLAGRSLAWGVSELKDAFPAESWFVEVAPTVQIPGTAEELLDLLPAGHEEAQAPEFDESLATSVATSARGRFWELVDTFRYSLMQRLLPRAEKEHLPELRELLPELRENRQLCAARGEVPTVKGH